MLYMYIICNFMYINLTCNGRYAATTEYTSRETLIAWRNKNHKWLELTEVRRETTNGIRVTVMPFYMGARVREYS